MTKAPLFYLFLQFLLFFKANDYLKYFCLPPFFILRFHVTNEHPQVQKHVPLGSPYRTKGLTELLGPPVSSGAKSKNSTKSELYKIALKFASVFSIKVCTACTMTAFITWTIKVLNLI